MLTTPAEPTGPLLSRSSPLCSSSPEDVPPPAPPPRLGATQGGLPMLPKPGIASAVRTTPPGPSCELAANPSLLPATTSGSARGSTSAHRASVSPVAPPFPATSKFRSAAGHHPWLPNRRRFTWNHALPAPDAWSPTPLVRSSVAHEPAFLPHAPLWPCRRPRATLVVLHRFGNPGDDRTLVATALAPTRTLSEAIAADLRTTPLHLEAGEGSPPSPTSAGSPGLLQASSFGSAPTLRLGAEHSPLSGRAGPRQG